MSDMLLNAEAAIRLTVFLGILIGHDALGTGAPKAAAGDPARAPLDQ